jgi:hypothetical protein
MLMMVLMVIELVITILLMVGGWRCRYGDHAPARGIHYRLAPRQLSLFLAIAR